MKKQYYGLKYPFTIEGEENYYIDLNKDMKEKVRSMLMHLIFTPKGQKIRDPEFGTDLIKYIFEPDDNVSWDGIKNEVSDAINKYINGIIIKDISVLKSEEDFSEIYVRVDYDVTNGVKSVSDSFVTKI